MFSIRTGLQRKMKVYRVTSRFAVSNVTRHLCKTIARTRAVHKLDLVIPNPSERPVRNLLGLVIPNRDETKNKVCHSELG